MNYLNTVTSVIHSPEYVAADPIQRATWWNLSLYSAAQENGGIIRACRGWKCRRWQQTCGITAEEVASTCELWRFDEEGHLHLWNYPLDKEAEVRAKRAGGAKGGRRSALKDAPSSSASSTPSSSASTERKGMEGNGREERETRPLAPAVRDDEMPDTAAAALECRLQSLCCGWRLPLTPDELAAAQRAHRTLVALTPEDWDLLRRYLSAKLPAGTPGYQPPTRLRFIEGVADVYRYATDWEHKQSRRRPDPAPPPAPAARTFISREESSAFLKTA